jgi:polyribonucleotide nucleotidyltransferase
MDIKITGVTQDILRNALEQAKRAPRYEPRHYPYFNRARVHVKRHEILEAIRELERALSIEPRYVTARRELHRLRGLLN